MNVINLIKIKSVTESGTLKNYIIHIKSKINSDFFPVKTCGKDLAHRFGQDIMRAIRQEMTGFDQFQKNRNQK